MAATSALLGVGLVTASYATTRPTLDAVAVPVLTVGISGDQESALNPMTSANGGAVDALGLETLMALVRSMPTYPYNVAKAKTELAQSPSPLRL